MTRKVNRVIRFVGESFGRMFSGVLIAALLLGFVNRMLPVENGEELFVLGIMIIFVGGEALSIFFRGVGTLLVGRVESSKEERQ